MTNFFNTIKPPQKVDQPPQKNVLFKNDLLDNIFLESHSNIQIRMLAKNQTSIGPKLTELWLF